MTNPTPNRFPENRDYQVFQRYYFLVNLDFQNQSRVLNERNKTLLFDSMSEERYALLHTWEAMGLINCDRSKDSYRSFSVIDIIWLRIVQRLHTAGCTHDVIKNAKHYLESDAAIFHASMPTLEGHLAYSNSYNKQAVLVVFADGSIRTAIFEDQASIDQCEKLKDCLVINLTEIFALLLAQRPAIETDADQQFNSLNTDEQQLVDLFRLYPEADLAVRRTGDKVSLFEMTHKEKPSTRIIELLNKGSFQNFQIKQKKGQVVAIHRTEQCLPHSLQQQLTTTDKTTMVRHHATQKSAITGRPGLARAQTTETDHARIRQVQDNSKPINSQ